MFWKNLFRPEKPGPRSDTSAANILDPTITGLFEDILNAGSHLRVRVTGRSMAPILRGGEMVTLKKVSFTSLHRGDLILFKNRHGVPLLHRIVHKRKSSGGKITFLTKGDALISFDEPVRDRNVLGKVCNIEKNNHRVEPKCLNMESKHWQSFNFTIAVTSLAISAFYYIIGKLRKTTIPAESVPLNYASYAVMNKYKARDTSRAFFVDTRWAAVSAVPRPDRR